MMYPDFNIKPISAQETYLVRQPVLREGRPISDCAFEGDEESSTLHLGLYFKNKLIGVATFLKNSNPVFSEKEQYQLRGMAVLKEFQKKGLGKLLLLKGEQQLMQKSDLIWLNGRERAVNFYKSNGYSAVGEPFLIENIGLHCIMVKNFIKKDKKLL